MASGKGGRPPKPIHLHLVQGTHRGDRHADPDTVPDPSKELPAPPAWLSERSAEIFSGLTTILLGMGLASRDFTDVLALASSRLEEVEVCTVVMEDSGRFYQSSASFDKEGRMTRQTIKSHPIVAQRNESIRHAHALLSELGLTPAAIGRVSALPKPKANDFADVG